MIGTSSVPSNRNDLYAKYPDGLLSKMFDEEKHSNIVRTAHCVGIIDGERLQSEAPVPEADYDRQRREGQARYERTKAWYAAQREDWAQSSWGSKLTKARPSRHEEQILEKKWAYDSGVAFGRRFADGRTALGLGPCLSKVVSSDRKYCLPIRRS